MYSTLVSFYVTNTKRYFARNSGAKLVTMIGFLAVLALLTLLTYEGFYYGFLYISRDTYFSEALTLYIVEMFLLVSFVLVFASALLSGVTQMFRTGRSGFLMASPNFTIKPTIVLSRMIVTSLWPLLTIIIPALFALRHVFMLSVSGFFFSLFSTIILVIFGVLLAVVLIFFIGVVLRMLGVFSKNHLIQMTLLTALYLLGFVWSEFRGIDLVKFFQARLLDVQTPNLLPILEQFRYFPSHFSAQSIYFAMRGENNMALASLLSLMFLCVAAYACYALLKKAHLYLWQKSEEKSSVGLSWMSRMSGAMLRSASGAKQAILKKEAVLFFRDGRGMLWLGFILLLWVIQIGSSHLLVHGLSAERVATHDAPGYAGLLQFSTIIFFIALFVLRFAFPSFSMERKTSWIIRMSPVDMREVYAAKLAFFVILFGIIALLFSLGSAATVGLVLPFGMPLVTLVVIATFFLTTLGLSLGAKYPNHETDDPEQLSTSMPGIGFILVSLFYGLAGAYAFANLTSSGSVTLYIMFICGSVALTLYFARIARTALVNIVVDKQMM